MTVGISSLSEFDAQAKAGKLRILAVSSAERLPDAKDIPTLQGERRRRRDPELAHGRRRAGHHRRAEGDAVRHRREDGEVQGVDRHAQAAKGWADTYLAGPAFEAQLAKDIAATQTILKDVGLSN